MENGRSVVGLEEVRRGDGHATRPDLDHRCMGGYGHYTAYGVGFGLESDDAAAFHLLLDRLPPGAERLNTQPSGPHYALSTDVADGGTFALSCDGSLLLRSHEIDRIAETFEQAIKWHVAHRAPRYVFLRAGVVGWKDRTIVLPGGPRSGKSTLVRALVRCGATCLSDEYAVFDGNTVHPYPSRIPIWTESSEAAGFWTDEFGEIREPKPLPIGIVVFATYQPGAVWKPRLLSRGKLMLGMFRHAVASQINPQQVLKVLDQVTKSCNALEGVRGDAHAVATFLLDRLV